MTQEYIVDLLDKISNIKAQIVTLKAPKDEWMQLCQLALMGCDKTQSVINEE